MISVILPAYNEEKALPVTLTNLLDQPGDYEVIVVDGGSVDATREIAERTPRVRLLSAAKGRASQMNAGARAAGGEWLLFLHADTFLPEGALLKLNAMEIRKEVRAGGFRQRFSGRDWRLRLISLAHNFRCRRTGVIYGDQAMFVRRRLFESLGGFPNQPIMEDIAFCEKLVRLTEPLLMNDFVLTDSRKFLKHGVWRSLGRVVSIQVRNEFGLPIVSRAFFEDVR